MNHQFLNYCHETCLKNGFYKVNPIIVFPTKRAGNEFSKISGTDFRQIISIEDLIFHWSGVELLSEVELLFLLFGIYKKTFPDYTFQEFEAWGKVMLQDFDLLDKYLINPERFFKQLSEIKSIEDISPLDDDAPLLFNFSKRIREENGLLGGFLSTWDLYANTYFELVETLKQSQKAYTGLAYRWAYERLMERESHQVPFHIFVGFNALTASESSMIKYLIKENKAEIFWDTDEWYISNLSNPSGSYIREARRDIEYQGFENKTNHIQLKEDKEGEQSLNFEYFGCNYTSQQFEIVNQLVGEKNYNPENTAFVLLDENILIPFKEQAKFWDFEIDYHVFEKFSSSTLFSILKSTIGFISSFEAENNSFQTESIYKFSNQRWIKDLQFMAPFFQDILEEINVRSYENEGNEGEGTNNVMLLTVPISLIRDNLRGENFNVLMDLLSNKAEAYINWIEFLIAHYSTKNMFGDELNCLSIGLEQFKKIQELKDENFSSFLGTEILSIFAKIKIYQKRESEENNSNKFPLLGLLETRCLDYENIIFIGTNDGILPKNSGYGSYIPEDLKFRNGIPRKKSNENIEGYYFFRLLQHAKNVHCTYVNNPENGKIISPYILQYLYLIKDNPAINLESNINSLAQNNNEITFPKNEHYFEYLKDILKKGISSTAITTYLECPLKFYFSRVKNMDEFEDFITGSDELESNTYGNVIHEVMENFYNGFGKDDKITGGIISQNWEIYSSDLIFNACKKHIPSFEELKALNALEIETIYILLEKLISDDIKFVNGSKNKYFQILYLEKKLNTNIKLKNPQDNLDSFTLSGYLDRVQLMDGKIQIIDYKTGSINDYYKEERGNYLDLSPFITDEKYYKELIQVGIYDILYQNNKDIQHSQNTQLFLYAFKNRVTNPKIENDFFEIKLEDDSNEFIDKLTTTIEQMLDRDLPIRQTHNPNHCTYCAFNHICKINHLNE